jgi:hypothetical protein
MNIKDTAMNKEEIKNLLERYYAGESTLEEELLLKRFFSQENVPEDLSGEKEIFSYYLQSSVVPEPSSGFENDIISALDTVDHKISGFKRRRIFGILTGIAAGMLLLTATYFFFVQKSGPRDTYSDPAVAYAETMKILNEVSIRLNHGTQALEHLSVLQDETQKSITTLNRSASMLKEKMKPLDNVLKELKKIDRGYDEN